MKSWLCISNGALLVRTPWSPSWRGLAGVLGSGRSPTRCSSRTLAATWCCFYKEGLGGSEGVLLQEKSSRLLSRLSSSLL